MSDTISRQAAIDAIRASTSKYTGFMEMEMYTDDDAVEAIEALPSAELEIIRCKNCRNNHWCNIQEAAMAGDNFFCGAAQRWMRRKRND